MENLNIVRLTVDEDSWHELQHTMIASSEHTPMLMCTPFMADGETVTPDGMVLFDEQDNYLGAVLVAYDMKIPEGLSVRLVARLMNMSEEYLLERYDGMFDDRERTVTTVVVYVLMPVLAASEDEALRVLPRILDADK